jgi:holo-[acyl-carrier protein] synthase
MILGIGVDVVDIARFGRQLERTPTLRERLFAPAERELALSSLAARFAAKEALIKAVGDSTGFTWQFMTVVSDGYGKPSFELSGTVADRIAAFGATRTHLSLSHDAGIASAFVVLESDG